MPNYNYIIIIIEIYNCTEN